jgi:hypothetical protein
VQFKSRATGSAPRYSFKTQSARAGKQVKTLGAGNIGRQPVKQGFTNAIASGSQSGGRRKTNLSAAPLAADNSQLLYTVGRIFFAGQLSAPMLRVLRTFSGVSGRIH